jgi:hypothetical protein
MLVIFLLGFFLDFIEIAVVVVPLVAPILLAAPDANVTAVWLGVMIGLNMQTSFLTPPFGFALFYLRGVAPKIVKTLDIYKGVIPFIGLQLLALTVVGLFPALVNYLPNRTFLTSDNAPPPMNPKLQQCLEEEVFSIYVNNEQDITRALDLMAAVDVSLLPSRMQEDIQYSIEQSRMTFDKVDIVNEARQAVADASDDFRPLHSEVRGNESHIRRLEVEIEEHRKLVDDARFDDTISAEAIEKAEASIMVLEEEIAELEGSIPAEWEEANAAYQELLKQLKFAEFGYRNHVDSAYRPLHDVMAVLENPERLAAMQSAIEGIESIITANDADTAMDAIQVIENQLADIPGADDVQSLVKKARRTLRGDTPNTVEAILFKNQAVEQLLQDVQWMTEANETILPALKALDAQLANNIGVRLQDSLSLDLALPIAACQSHHKDVSLNF